MIFIVTDKATGAETYRYQADAPIEWSGFEFATHDHAELVEVVEGVIQGASRRILTKLEYLRRFTMEERIAVRQAAESSPMLADYLAMMELAEEIDTGDADTIGAVNMLEQVGLIAAGRANEVLNGN
jgi:hypothetical protein